MLDLLLVYAMLGIQKLSESVSLFVVTSSLFVSVSVTSVSSTWIEFLFAYFLVFCLTVSFSSSSSRLSALPWPTQTLKPHADVITAKHHFIRAVCEMHVKLFRPQVKHMHGNVPEQRLFVSRTF